MYVCKALFVFEENLIGDSIKVRFFCPSLHTYFEKIFYKKYLPSEAAALTHLRI